MRKRADFKLAHSCFSLVENDRRRTKMILDGKTKVYADIGEDQDVVKMDAHMARTLFEYYNKYVELTTGAQQDEPHSQLN